LPNGWDLSQALVQAGYAWHDTRYAPHDKRLAQLQAEAQAAQRGLWAEANPVPPWGRQGQRQPASAEVPQGADASQAVIVGTDIVRFITGPAVRVQQGIQKEPCSVQDREAGAGGYRPAENCP
jgi:hypothetical protein